MINFVEELPTEWKPKWDLLLQKAGRTQESLASMFAFISS